MPRRMRFPVAKVVLLTAITVQLACGCATLSVRYTDSPAGAAEVIIRHLRSPDQYLSPQEYMNLKHPTTAIDHVKDLQRKLVSPSLYVFRFTADTEIHAMVERKEPPAKIVSLLAKTFPADSQDLADKSNLEAEFTPGRDTSTPGIKGSTEETWLIFNKKTGKYFFYLNATPDPRDCASEPPRREPFQPW